MEQVSVRIRTVLFFGYVALSTFVAWWIFLAAVPFALVFDPVRRRVLNTIMSMWGYHFVSLMPMWGASWTGRENLPHRDQPVVIVANHQSMADIPVLFGLGRNFKFVSKASVFQVPIIGWAMRLNDYIEVRRGDPDSVARMFAACRRHLRSGNSVLIFPEGTRTRDGRLKPFKPGAFVLAHELGVPVLPVVLDNTGEAIPKSGPWLTAPWGLDVPVRVLPAVEPSAFESPEALSEAVHGQMALALADIRGLPVASVVGDVPERRRRGARMRTPVGRRASAGPAPT